MSALAPSRYLLRAEINGVNMLPIWRKIRVRGYKCELVAGTKSVCVVCAPRGKRKR